MILTMGTNHPKGAGANDHSHLVWLRPEQPAGGMELIGLLTTMLTAGTLQPERELDR
jgi:hypothetical protein